MFWRFRNEILFLFALGFALKALVRPDAASVAGLVLLLTAHYIDRFFGSERVEQKIIARVKTLEDALRDAKAEIGHIKVNAGMKSNR